MRPGASLLMAPPAGARGRGRSAISSGVATRIMSGSIAEPVAELAVVDESVRDEAGNEVGEHAPHERVEAP